MRRKRTYTLVGSLALATLMTATPTLGHHSFAMFDSSKEIVLSGTVKEFQWTNPHSWVQVIAPDTAGKMVEWSVEGGSPNTLSRQGWTKGVMKPGDKIAVTVNPMKDGSNGGSLVRVELPNGSVLGKPKVGARD